MYSGGCRLSSERVNGGDRLLPIEVGTVVAGGGTTGAVVAATLAAAGESVLLLEAGPDYGPFDAARWPRELLDPSDTTTSHDWNIGVRRPSGGLLAFERGRVIGGSSAVNGCVVSWGCRADYDNWVRAGLHAWSAERLEPLLRTATATLRSRRYGLAELTPFQRLWHASAPSVGIPAVADLNDLDGASGIAPSEFNVAEGVRWNASFAFLDPVRQRNNLTIVGGCVVDRVLLDGTRVHGIRAVTNAGIEDVAAGRAILTAGTYGSPAILMRSGIGDPASVARAGVTPVVELPGVGRNLQDHLAVMLRYTGTPRLVRETVQFARHHRSPHEQVIAKARSSVSRGPFDLHLYPVGGASANWREPWKWKVGIALLQPTARGHVSIATPDPRSAPTVDARHILDPSADDLKALADGIEIARSITAATQVGQTLGQELSRWRAGSSRSHVRGWIRENLVHYHHPVGTCRMGGPGDADAVVDAAGAVRGVSGLFVADCSVMPRVPRANTNVPAAALALGIAQRLTRAST
jgi:choline dehydrogenase